MTARAALFLPVLLAAAPARVEGIPDRIAQLGDPDAEVRAAAFRDLLVEAERDPRSVLAALPRTVDDPEVAERCRELRERIGSASVRERALLEAEGETALEGILLAFFGKPPAAASVEELYRDLGERSVRFRSLSLHLLDHPEPSIRLAAVGGLAESAGIRALHLVLSRAGDPDPAVRAGVVRAAAGILDPDTTLREIDRFPVVEKGWDDLLRSAGGETGASLSVACLKRVFLREPRREARARALIALGYSGDPGLADWFRATAEERARKGDALLSGIAVYAAAFSAGERESAWFASFLEHPDPFLAIAGALALCRVAGADAPASFRQFETLDPLSILEMAMGFSEMESPWPDQPALLDEARAWWQANRGRFHGR